jgi:PAS domain S-box-containing protein
MRSIQPSENSNISNRVVSPPSALPEQTEQLWLAISQSSIQNSNQAGLTEACIDYLSGLGYAVQLPEATQSKQATLDAIANHNHQNRDLVLINATTLSELIHTRSLYQVGFERSEDAILVFEVGNDGSFSHYCDVNAAACRLLGYSKSELLLRSAINIDITAPNLSFTDITTSSDRLFLSKNGEKIPVNLSVNILEIRGKKVALTFARDQRDRKQTETELHNSQNRLQAVLDAVPGYVSWIDAGDRYLGVNQKLADSLCLTPSQIIGQKVGFMFRSRDFQQFIQQFRQSTEQAGSIISTDVCIEPDLQSDQRISYLIAAQKYQNDQIVIVGIDITEQEAAKAALQGLNQALETKVKIRTSELALVNHKLTSEIEVRQKIEHSLNFHLKRLETAYRMVFAMNQAETLEDIYSRSLRGLASIFSISRLAILLADDQGVMRFKITRGMSESFRKSVEKQAQEHSRELSDSNTQPMIYYDTIEIPFPEILQEAMESEGINAMVVFPLIYSGLMIGEIVIYSDQSLKLSQEEIQIGKTIATYIAVAITRKQTEISLRKSEGQFRQIFRDASIGMALANIRTRRFTKVNSALCQMLNFSEVEFLALAMDDITHPHDLSQDMRQLLQASYGQIESYRLEKRFLRKDGKILWASSTVTVLRDTDGHPTSILVMVEDTSDRKAAEIQIRKTEALSLELEKEKELNILRTRFFSMASHEFRTPIGAILMNANILEYANDTALNQKSLRSLQRIRANVKHLISLLDDVLTINRADTGRLEFSPQLLDVSELCQRVIDDLFTEETLPGRIKFKPRGDRPYLAMIDERLFVHMLTNLLTNAGKYSDPNTDVEIVLAARELGKISIEIRDRGIGIDPKDIPYLFDAFYRGENVGKVTGSGLGLTIVKKSVELHDGEIEVESEIGIGTCFKVDFPSYLP